MVSLYNFTNLFKRDAEEEARKGWLWMDELGFSTASFSCEGLHQNHVRWLWDFNKNHGYLQN